MILIKRQTPNSCPLLYIGRCSSSNQKTYPGRAERADHSQNDIIRSRLCQANLISSDRVAAWEIRLKAVMRSVAPILKDKFDQQKLGGVRAAGRSPHTSTEAHTQKHRS